MVILVVFIILVFILFIIFIIKKISVYNRSVELMEEIEESKKNLFGELNDRSNLVLEMERIVKHGFELDEKILDKVLKAREKSIKQINFADRMVSENALVKELCSVVTVLTENYPTLASTKLYQEVIKGLKDKSDSIQAAIRVHNANIRAYNVFRGSFSGLMFGPVSHPQRIEYPALEKLEEKKLTDLLIETSQHPPLKGNHKNEAENNEEEQSNNKSND